MTANFALADKLADFLAAGETLTATYNVTVNDGHGGTSTQPVTFTVTGTNDAPVLGVANTSPQTTETFTFDPSETPVNVLNSTSNYYNTVDRDFTFVGKNTIQVPDWAIRVTWTTLITMWLSATASWRNGIARMAPSSPCRASTSPPIAPPSSPR